MTSPVLPIIEQIVEVTDTFTVIRTHGYEPWGFTPVNTYYALCDCGRASDSYDYDGAVRSQKQHYNWSHL